MIFVGNFIFFLLQAMQNHAAVFRDGPSLKEGVDKMYAINKELNDIKVILAVHIHC